MTWRDAAMIAVGAVLGCGLLWGVLAWEAGTAPFFPKAQHGACMCRQATGECLCLIELLSPPRRRPARRPRE